MIDTCTVPVVLVYLKFRNVSENVSKKTSITRVLYGFM